MKGLYIHIPFCKNICSYCDFCKFLYQEKWVGAYLKCLKNEIKDRYLDDEVSTIYIGGGTPSCLNIEQLKYLFKIIKNIKLTTIYEFTFECNIEDIKEDLLFILKENGVNRLSIGIQSFNKKNLEFMNRHADFKDALKKINLCRQFGFNNINIDLIYAIPGQKIRDLKKDLKLFLKLKPDHISTYSLIIEENTLLKVENIKPISEELDYDMFKLIEKKLKKYHHYEISNFALKNKESKHNLIYWNNLEYYGFGLSAAGYIEQIRYENTKNLKDYLLGNYIKEKTFISKDEQMNYEVMLGLRKLQGINLKEFESKYHISFKNAYKIDKLLKNKDLIEKKGYIYINPDKLYVMNEILLKII
ncbi:MAG: radical SAM family heme chaperone HemW [Firmicutes bacterium]|nr:radical SAM family heme chaperone HemW [Bacillota bacterium]